MLAQTGVGLRALDWRDLLDPLAAVQRLVQPWLALGRDVARFVVHTEGGEFTPTGTLPGRGPLRRARRGRPAALARRRAVLGEQQAVPVLRALDQGGELLLRILRHPLSFLTNLVTAGRRGFASFLTNGPRHLLASMQDWLALSICSCRSST